MDQLIVLSLNNGFRRVFRASQLATYRYAPKGTTESFDGQEHLAIWLLGDDSWNQPTFRILGPEAKAAEHALLDQLRRGSGKGHDLEGLETKKSAQEIEAEVEISSGDLKPIKI